MVFPSVTRVTVYGLADRRTGLEISRERMRITRTDRLVGKILFICLMNIDKKGRNLKLSGGASLQDNALVVC
jgi:hypothetical protein